MTEKQNHDQLRSYIAERNKMEAERTKAVNDAADQILSVSSRLNLTWDEFEQAISLVKSRGRIS